jgi:nucleotidyltransferase substrate binding protein (TIGR01987 family)
MPLDLTSLRQSIAALERAVQASSPSPLFDASPAEVRETLRAGTIQAFEVAYEQSWKMIKRWLEMNFAPDAADGITRRELYRRARESRLLDDIDLWMMFHEIRNLTAHTYNPETADEAWRAATSFATHAHALLDRLEMAND